jgi:hypothetical protein
MAKKSSPAPDRGSVQEAIVNYCARFTHKGCGGHPVAWLPGNQVLGCTLCDLRVPVPPNEPLGKQLEWEG